MGQRGSAWSPMRKSPLSRRLKTRCFFPSQCHALDQEFWGGGFGDPPFLREPQRGENFGRGRGFFQHAGRYRGSGAADLVLEGEIGAGSVILGCSMD